MKKRFLYFSLILFSLFISKSFPAEIHSDHSRFFGPFPSRIICPKILAVEEFERIEKQTLSTGCYTKLSHFPFTEICFEGDISAIHYTVGRLPTHSFQLRANADGTETLSLFEQDGILSFKAYYDVILRKGEKLVIGADEYKAPYRLVLQGRITDKERFLRGPRK